MGSDEYAGAIAASSESSQPRTSPLTDGPRLGSVELDAWFAEHGRDLPWRRTRDPWSIVVAEMMLQQTQVARVIVRWHRFLERFPTAAVCAAAAPGDVIDEWSGLGYNRRAIYLHRLAVTVVEHHEGAFPSDLKALLALPGIGPYTARAIRVFADEQPDAVLDTNVARILARTHGRQLGRKEAQDLADRNLGEDPWVWNQALLDIGARFCTARNTTCEPCPFGSVCLWTLAGQPEPDPARGSAGVSTKQSTFSGSDRQGRGRLVNALRYGSIETVNLAAAMGWPDDEGRASRVAASLVADGLVELADGRYALAGHGTR